MAHGIIEREGKVVYLVVQRLEPMPRAALGADTGGLSMSRDFH